MKEASGVCLGILAAAIVLYITNHLQFFSKKTAVLTGALLVGILILENMNSMIRLGSQTVSEISEYGKLLLPVMTTALAAQGGVSVSAALYAGTAVFDAILSALISKLLVPIAADAEEVAGLSPWNTMISRPRAIFFANPSAKVSR